MGIRPGVPSENKGPKVAPCKLSANQTLVFGVNRFPQGGTLTVFIEPGKHGNIIRQKYWDRGEPCPMVVSVGQAPVLGASARASAPPGVDELAVAGGRLGRAIEVVRGPVTGLAISV